MQDQATASFDRSELVEDVLCAVSYLTILPAAVMLLVPATARNPRVRFHACQSILMNWFLGAAVFALGLSANFERIMGAANGVQTASMLLWTARILCMSVWAIASIRIATGRSFRIAGLSVLAERQANGRLFRRLAPSSALANAGAHRAAHAH